MATPNIASIATINGFLQVGDLTTTASTNLLTATAEYTFKIESIYLCNADTANTCTATLELSMDGSNFYYLCNGLIVPPATTISVLDRPIYIDESDIIRGSASANGDIDYAISGTKLAD